SFAARSEDITLIDGADPAPYNTKHIEGPHIYKIEGQYYVSAAGGGTGLNHQQLIFRSQNILGPYLSYENNPILTQVGLAKDR
ncbi:family 43 glycosylhydrolase, partial [Vallitalea sediminicola]